MKSIERDFTRTKVFKMTTVNRRGKWAFFSYRYFLRTDRNTRVHGIRLGGWYSNHHTATKIIVSSGPAGLCIMELWARCAYTDDVVASQWTARNPNLLHYIHNNDMRGAFLRHCAGMFTAMVRWVLLYVSCCTGRALCFANLNTVPGYFAPLQCFVCSIKRILLACTRQCCMVCLFPFSDNFLCWYFFIFLIFTLFLWFRFLPWNNVWTSNQSNCY